MIYGAIISICILASLIIFWRIINRCSLKSPKCDHWYSRFGLNEEAHYENGKYAIEALKDIEYQLSSIFVFHAAHRIEGGITFDKTFGKERLDNFYINRAIGKFTQEILQEAKRLALEDIEEAKKIFNQEAAQ